MKKNTVCSQARSLPKVFWVTVMSEGPAAPTNQGRIGSAFAKVVVRLAPGEEHGRSREKIGQGGDRLQMPGRLVPRKKQLDMHAKHSCEEVDIGDADVAFFSFGPPPVGQSSPAAAGRRVHCEAAGLL